MKVSKLGGMKLTNFNEDQRWACNKIQPLAIRQIYAKVWPNSQVQELDNDQSNRLKQTLDISGLDKLLSFSDKTVAFLGQRFRRYEESEYDDFTVRFSRPGYARTECEKLLRALSENRLLISFYAYGHVNKQQNGFLRFRILKFREFLEAWRDRKIPAPLGPIPNKDGTTFLAWHFSKIPEDLVYWNLKSYPMKLGDFPTEASA